MIAEHKGHVKNRHGQSIAVDHTFNDDHYYDLTLIPGGPGTWDQIDNPRLLK